MARTLMNGELLSSSNLKHLRNRRRENNRSVTIRRGGTLWSWIDSEWNRCNTRCVKLRTKGRNCPWHRSRSRYLSRTLRWKRLMTRSTHNTLPTVTWLQSTCTRRSNERNSWERKRRSEERWSEYRRISKERKRDSRSLNYIVKLKSILLLSSNISLRSSNEMRIRELNKKRSNCWKLTVGCNKNVKTSTSSSSMSMTKTWRGEWTSTWRLSPQPTMKSSPI